MDNYDFQNYTLQGVLQFIADKFHEFDVERIKWEQEREELVHKISCLESEKSYLEQQLSEIVNQSNQHTDDYASSGYRSIDSTGQRYRSVIRLVRIIAHTNTYRFALATRSISSFFLIA